MHRRDEGLDDASWDRRETFAYFGFASYQVSVPETGLAHALLWSNFLTRVGKEYRATKGQGFDRAGYEAAFDKFMEQQFDQTMGNLLQQSNSVPELSAELKSRIRRAKERRDFLAHRFWRERCIEFATESGREKLRSELKSDAELFEQLDREVNEAMKVVRVKLGVKEEWLEAHAQKMIARIEAGLSPDE